MQPVAFREFRIFIGDGRPDRTLWAAGPWDDEGDTAQWRDQDTRLACRIDRRPRGEWAGLVEVPGDGKLAGLSVVDCMHPKPECERRCPTVTCLENSIIGAVDVHGLLAFAGLGPFQDAASVWFFGFHCGHEDNDLVPRHTFEFRRMRIAYPFGESALYRSAEYATAECGRLARQIATLSFPAVPA